jgi:5-methyltetrahydropteroyltriglutamate--homocysteine methyltransferase
MRTSGRYGKIVTPGVIETVTAHVEHAEVVAQCIIQYANIVGRDNVIAAPDRGFSTFVGLTSVGEDVMWVKFESLVKVRRACYPEALVNAHETQ